MSEMLLLTDWAREYTRWRKAGKERFTGCFDFAK